MPEAGLDGAVFAGLHVMALRLVAPVRQAAWYAKKGRDVFRRPGVRASRRLGEYFVNSKTGGDRLELSCRGLDALLDQLATAA